MGTYIDPFDLYTIFVGYFLGNSALFAFFLVFVYALVAAYFSMPEKPFVVLLILGFVLFGEYVGEAIYILTLMVVGFILYKIFSRLFE